MCLCVGSVCVEVRLVGFLCCLLFSCLSWKTSSWACHFWCKIHEVYVCVRVWLCMGEWVCMGPWLWPGVMRSEEHTSELQSLMRISYAVFCLKNTRQRHTM